MDLSLSDAARALGKSDRQIRYLIQRGKLKAGKVEGRWVIASGDLPLSAAERDARQRRAVELEQTVHEALGPFLRPRERRVYSVRDLAAFEHARRASAEVCALLGSEHAAARALEDAIVRLASGCHRFHKRDKHEAFAEARESAARCVALLYLAGRTEAETVARTLEAELLPSLAGLLRRSERGLSA